jgi:hypothetical protein
MSGLKAQNAGMCYKKARLSVGCDDVPTLPAPRREELPRQPVGLSCKPKLPGTDRPVCSKPALIGAAVSQDPAASDEAPALPSALELRAEKLVWFRVSILAMKPVCQTWWRVICRHIQSLRHSKCRTEWTAVVDLFTNEVEMG